MTRLREAYETTYIEASHWVGRAELVSRAFKGHVKAAIGVFAMAALRCLVTKADWQSLPGF